MERTKHVFDFSFVSAKEGKTNSPSLVFTVNVNMVDTIFEHIRTLELEYFEHAKEYFKDPFTKNEHHFSMPPDLFGNMHFGYGKAGTLKYDENGAHFVFECFNHEYRRKIALTLHILLRALDFVVYDKVSMSNQSQLVRFETSALPHRTGGWEHAVSGDMYPPMSVWLQEYAERKSKRKTIKGFWGYEYVTLPRGVITAMRDTWRHVANPEGKKWDRDCRGSLSLDGRFSLQCPGDACDLSVYPDSFRKEYSREYPTTFSCHNLDAAAQQLTLLAGFAKLSSIVRKSLDKNAE